MSFKKSKASETDFVAKGFENYETLSEKKLA